MAALRLGRRLVALWLLAFVAALLALVLGEPVLAVAATLLACTTALAARLPKAGLLSGSLSTPAAKPMEGDAFDLEVTLANAGRRPMLGQWRARLPPTIEAQDLAGGYDILPARGRQAHTIRAASILFGRQTLGPVEFRMEDPFGLVTRDTLASGALDLGVQPRRESLRDAPLKTRQQRALLGAYEVSQPGSGFEFFGLRSYAVGDRPRDINWKASARTGSLVVNQHEKESDAEVVLLIDVRSDAAVGRLTASPFAQSCRAALAVAEAHLKARDAVRFVVYGTEALEDTHTGSQRHLNGILEMLMQVQPAGRLPVIDVAHHILPSLKARSPVMLFTSAANDPTVAQAAMLLRSHDLPVMVFVPEPDWGDQPPAGSRAWHERQQKALGELRRLGLPVAIQGTGTRLATSLATLEVAA